MKAAVQLIRSLEQEGVRWIFGVPGEENIDLMDAILDSNIEFIVTRHEQGAAFMAGMVGRLTGKPGVCLSTLGPGATNLTTGVANANLDHSPLVAIVGQTNSNLHHKRSHQYYNLVSLFGPITKWSSTIRTKDTLQEVVHKAFRLAEEERPGAAMIELPEDIAGMNVETKPFQPASVTTYPVAAGRSLEEAKHMINQYQKPLILAGNGITRRGASKELRALAEKLQCPVVHTFMGKGALPWTHSLSLLTAGLSDKDYVSCGFDYADLVITIGFDIEEYSPSQWNPDGEKPILHIDTQSAETDQDYPVKLSLIGDIKENLSMLTAKVSKRHSADHYYTQLRENILNMISEYDQDTSYPIKPQKIINDLRTVMGEQDIVISDVGAHKLWIARMYPCYETNTCLISNGFAAMGYSLPSSIAAKLVNPDKKVVAVCGDGAFQMSMQELETAVRLKLPIVILVLRDERYGLIEWHQQKHFERTSHISFGNPDLVQLAHAYGAKGLKVEAADQLKHILQSSLEMKGPVVIDCPVDEKENIKLTRELSKVGC